MLKSVLLVVSVAMAALLVWVGMQPAEFRVERSALMNAAPTAVYEHVNDLRKWEAWSPWAKRDPNAKSAFEGPPSGPGAIMRWDGNDEVGKGAMAITEAVPGEAINIRLDFVRPFEGTSTSGFSFRPEGAGTRVTWTLSGTQGYMERLICTVLMLDMDEMIGNDYEAGLAALKSVAEAPAPG
jgi:hypothetical protein